MKYNKGDKVMLIMSENQETTFEWYIELCKKKVIATVVEDHGRLVTVQLHRKHADTLKDIIGKTTIRLYKRETHFVHSAATTGGI